MSYEYVLQNGRIVDGTGSPWYRGDVAIADGRIAAVGAVEPGGAVEIDLDGDVVAPGFIDIHTHSDFTLPAILLVALYIQFHGEYSPGGGFQAGVVFGTGVWLYALVHGLERTQRIIPPAVVRFGVSLGLLLYIGVGFACLLLGENFLDYDALGGHGGAAGHDGGEDHLG